MRTKFVYISKEKKVLICDKNGIILTVVLIGLLNGGKSDDFINSYQYIASLIYCRYMGHTHIQSNICFITPYAGAWLYTGMGLDDPTKA